MQSYKVPILILIGCLLPFIIKAQTYFQVTDTNGTQSLGSINVTVTPIAAVGVNTTCGVGPYRGNSSNLVGSYRYKFSYPVGVVRIHFCAVNQGDTVSVQFNGQHYNITTANLSSYGGICGLVPYCDSIVNGNIGGVTAGDNLVQLDVQPGFPIDSAQVDELAAGGAGVAWDFFFSKACPGRVTASAVQDSICAGASLYLLSDTSFISDSVTYSWTGPNGFSSSQRNPILSNLQALASGTYTVIAHDTGTCNYISSVNVTVTPLPVPVIFTNSPLCPTDTLHLTCDTITSAIYTWAGPNSFSSPSQNPSITSFIAADTGYYQLTASVNGCTGYATKHVVLKNIGVPLIAYNTPVCPGDTMQLSAIDTTSGVNYVWTGPAGFSSSLQNPIFPNVQAVNAGVYYITAHLSGCSNSDSAYIYVTPSVPPPAIFIYVSPNDTICINQVATFTAVASNAGSSPVYQWRKNGTDILGATASTYLASSIADGDNFTCKVTGYVACQSIDTNNSNTIQMHIAILPPPNVTLSVYPPYFVPGESEVFTGHVPPGDTGLSYQWTRNGVKIPGSTNIIYTTNSLTSNDTICLIVYSSNVCTYPDSFITCLGLVLGINAPGILAEDIIIYPNPANSVLYIEIAAGLAKEDVEVYILSMDGRIVLKQNAAAQMDISYLPDGIYMVQVYSKAGFLLKKEKLIKMRQ